MKKLSFIILLIASFPLINFTEPAEVKPIPHFETETEALDALAFMSSLYAYPHTDVTNGKYYSAYEHYRKHFVQAEGSRSEAWENIGPRNIGGRTTSIAIDPNDTSIVYLGSASGGLWKSTSGGIGADAWTYIPTGFPVLGVSAIAINPSNSNEIFIGTGETYAYGTSTNGLVTRTERGSFGVGILKTTDGGATWEISLDWTYQENRGIWDIVFDPTNSDVLHAATTEGIYKSIDNGATWEQKLDRKMVMDIDINAEDPNILFAGVGNLSSLAKGIYKSTDAGENWDLLTGGGLPPYNHDGRISITSSPSDPDILVAMIGNAFNTVGIYKTVNSGASWTQLDAEDVVTYQGWYAKGVLINSANDEQMLFGGVELFKTTDDGAVIIQKTAYIGPDSPMHPDIHDIISNPLDPQLVYIITDGGLARSNDFGETFYACVDGYVTSQFYIGSMSGQSNEVGLGGLQDNFTLRYGGTENWLPVIGGDGSFNAINPEDDAVQYGSYQYGNIYKSYDQGFGFFEQIYTSVGAAAFITPFVLCPSQPNTIYVGDTKLRRSDDAGGIFVAPNPALTDTNNVIISIGVSSLSTDTVYYSAAGIAGRADMFRSFDGGESDEPITNGLPDRYYRDIAVNANDARELVICLSGFGTPHIYRSVDAGDNWEDISVGLPDVPFHAVLFDPSDDSILYAGSDFNVFVSYDKGGTWEAITEGWPDAAMVFDLYASPSDNQLVAATHGHGVYRTDFRKKEDPQVNIDDEATRSFSVYPTLAYDAITIDGIETGSMIEVFDMHGKVVLQTKSAGEKQMLDCSMLPTGNYFVRLAGMGKQSVKFVKG